MITTRQLVKRYHTKGLLGLQDDRHHNLGAPTLLTPIEQQTLAAQLQQDFDQGIVWEGKQVQAWVKEQFGKDVYLGRTYEWLRAAGFTLQKPRPQHVNGDLAAKEAFKTKS